MNQKRPTLSKQTQDNKKLYKFCQQKLK